MSEPDKPSSPDARAMISIDEQIDEIGKQARSLERFSGRMTTEVRDAKLRRLYAAEASLRTIKTHADGLRTLIGWLKSQQSRGVEWEDPSPALAAVLLDQPSVRSVVSRFPDVVLTGSRPISALERAGLLDKQGIDADEEPDAAVA